jgi:hypothetical protein
VPLMRRFVLAGVGESLVEDAMGSSKTRRCGGGRDINSKNIDHWRKQGALYLDIDVYLYVAH